MEKDIARELEIGRLKRLRRIVTYIMILVSFPAQIFIFRHFNMKRYIPTGGCYALVGFVFPELPYHRIFRKLDRPLYMLITHTVGTPEKGS